MSKQWVTILNKYKITYHITNFESGFTSAEALKKSSKTLRDAIIDAVKKGTDPLRFFTEDVEKEVIETRWVTE